MASVMHTPISARRLAVRPAAVAVLFVLAASAGAQGAPLAEPRSVWSRADVRVNDPGQTFGGPPIGVREPVVALHPRDPKVALAAVIDHNVSNTHTYGSWAGSVHVYRSGDGGRTWRDSLLVRVRDNARRPDPAAPFWSSGDPTLTFDSRGNAYLAVLADRIHQEEGGLPHSTRGGIEVYRTSDAGRTWQGPFQAVRRIVDEANSRCEAPDKELLGVHPRTGELYLAYTWFRNDCPRTELESYQSLLIAGQENIDLFFQRSRDGGRTWTKPVSLFHGYASGAQPVAGPDGTLYVAFMGAVPSGSGSQCALSWFHTAVMRRPSEEALIVAISRDGGRTWTKVQRPVCNTGGLHPAEGAAGLAVGPSIAVDPSTGHVHVAWATLQTHGTFGIWGMSSSDRGSTWRESATFPSMPERDLLLPALAAERGVARVTWVAGSDRGSTWDVFASESRDGGMTWSSPNRLSTQTTSATGENGLGDYIWMDAAGNRFAAIWTDGRSGGATDVYVRLGEDR
jgi:hypothetical protein